MGQSVSSQLGANTLGVGVDPEYVRQQILQQRERQLASISNPQQQLAARLGGLLGGGISNIAQGRGFFEVNDPLLNKVTQISGIYNQVASQIDPNSNPTEFFSALQRAYADAGLGQQALMAGQEAQKARASTLELQGRELALLEKDVEGIPAKIQAAMEAGNEAEAQRLANIYNRVVSERELNKRVKEAQIGQATASAAASRATAETKDIIYVPDITGQKIPYVREGDKLVPLKVEGGTTGSSTANKGKKLVYNMKTGRPEFQ